MSEVHFDTEHSKEKNAVDRPYLNYLKRIEIIE